MSNENKKALLNEATTKRFWKLAGLRPIHEKAYVFEEDEDLEEGMMRSKEDEEEVDEMKRPQGSGIRGVYDDSTEDPNKYKAQKVGTKGSTVQTVEPRKMNEDDLEEMGMPAAEDDMAAENPVPEQPDDLDAEGPEDGQDVEVDVPEGDVASLKTARDILDQILSAVGGEEEPELDAEPELDDEPGLEDEEDALQEVDQEELEEVAARIADRVARRITEALLKNKKK